MQYHAGVLVQCCVGHHWPMELEKAENCVSPNLQGASNLIYMNASQVAWGPEASSWRVVSVMKSCFCEGLQFGSDALGQTWLGSKAVLEILVMFTTSGQAKFDGTNPVFKRSSRVASIFGEISILQFFAPWRVTHVLHKPVQEPDLQGKFIICSLL